MKVPASTVMHEGNLTLTTRTRMSLDIASLPHLMSVLTDLYSNPTLAVIREYSCNALDAHVAANNPNPIQVYLPNALDQTFRVVDQGVGLSVHEITELFSKYGWSSKRETDGEVGMLGLGCKSGLTYTSQFTLIAVQDGVKTTVLVTRDTDGVGAIQVLDTSPTDAPTGVEVRIPVKDHYNFSAQARQFFRFWGEGTVLVNDVVPERIGSDANALWLDPDVLVVNSTIVSTDHVVMGNVPYPVDSAHRLIPNSNHYAIIWVPIGSVDFTPSREALHLTTRTKEVLKEAREYIQSSSFRIAQKEVDAATNPYDAWKTSQKWRRFLVGTPLIFGGEKIPHHDRVSGNVLVWNCPGTELREYAAAQRKSGVYVSHLEDSWFITGHNTLRLTHADKTRLVRYRVEHKIKPERVYVAEELLGLPWLEKAPKHTTDWSEIRKVQLTTKKSMPSIAWYGKSPADDETNITFLTSKVVLTKNFNGYDVTRTLPDFYLAYAPKTVLKQWQKEVPHARPLPEVVQEEGTKFIKNLTPAQAYAMQNMYCHSLRLSKANIEDPVLAGIARLSQNEASVLRQRYDAFTRLKFYLNQYVGVTGITVTLPDLPSHDEVLAAVKRYPLLRGSDQPSQLAEYVNALFAWRNRNEKD